MFKTVALIKKKNGMSMEEFISYYEANHAPLAKRLMPRLTKYVRHFLHPYGNQVYGAGEDQPYHVATEMWFADRADFEKSMADLAEPETAAILGADEEKLFERASIRIMIVEDRETNLGR